MEKFFQDKDKQDKHIIRNPNPEKNSPRNSPSPSPEISQRSGEDGNYEDENYYQDAQDPNEDSEMSFDSVALHYLDT